MRVDPHRDRHAARSSPAMASARLHDVDPGADGQDTRDADVSGTRRAELGRVVAGVEVRVGVDHAVRGVGASTRGNSGAAGSMPDTASVRP